MKLVLVPTLSLCSSATLLLAGEVLALHIQCLHLYCTCCSNKITTPKRSMDKMENNGDVTSACSWKRSGSCYFVSGNIWNSGRKAALHGVIIFRTVNHYTSLIFRYFGRSLNTNFRYLICNFQNNFFPEWKVKRRSIHANRTPSKNRPHGPSDKPGKQEPDFGLDTNQCLFLYKITIFFLRQK